jgi:murein L,D-transpeptidase YafK
VGRHGQGWAFIHSYLIRSGSGRLGPKLRSGDHQVPEGIYRVTGFNPKSRFYLSMRLDYPNEFDRSHVPPTGALFGRRHS